MRRHLTDASWLFAADVGARALGFVAVASMARTLAPERYGSVVIGAAILDYALLAADWGLKTLGTRETARPPESRRFEPHTIATARLILSLAVFVVANLLLSVLPVEPSQQPLIRVYLLGLLPYALLVDWYHQGRGAFSSITVGRVLGSLLLLAGALTLVREPEHAARVPWIFVGSMGVTSIAMLAAAAGSRARLAPGRGDIARAPEVFGASTALGVAALFGQTFIVLPTIVAGEMLGARPAGLLNAALRIVMIVLIVDRVFGAIYLPALTRVWERDREQAPVRLDAAFRLVVALGIGASTLCAIFAEPLLRLAFGPDYTDAARTLALVAPFVAATLVNTFFAYGLIAIGEERLYLRSGVLSGLLFVALIVVATPLWGLDGVAIAMVVGETAMTALLALAFRRHVRLHALRPIAISLAVGTALLIAAQFLGERAIWQAPLVGALFAGAVTLLRGVRIDDLRARAS